jgi:hypothetical protein
VTRERRECVERIKAGGRAEALFHVSCLVSFCGDHGPVEEGGARGPCRRTKRKKEIDRAVEKAAGASVSLYLVEGSGWQMRRAVRVVTGPFNRKA